VRKLTVTFSIACLLYFLFLSYTAGASASRKPAVHGFYPDTVANDKTASLKTAELIYDSLQLQQYGLSKRAWIYAYKGYQKLLAKGRIPNPGIISVCDFGLSSKQKRLFIINVDNYELVLNTYVAHGRRSGSEYARSFSNRSNSHQSSLGFYITGNTYYGEHGFSLRINGVDKGFNDKAVRRNIVIHGSDYASDDFLRSNCFLGRSYGCPAVPKEETETIINAIKEGTCFFIYHPTKKYLTASKILND
jgi:L,D-transpeptidase-like protein